MNTNFLKNRPNLRTSYGRNGLIQLVLTIGVAFILIHGLKVILIISSPNPKEVFSNMLPYLAISNFDQFLEKPWTIFTYFWGHASFWNLLSNMIWLYCFGSIIQTLVGYKEIFPLFIISNICSALIFLGISSFFPALNNVVLNSLPGVVAFATASIFLAPRFRFHITEHLSIPLWAVLLVFLFLSLGSYLNNPAYLVLLISSALVGALYVVLLKNGFRPGNKLHIFWAKLQNGFSPDFKTSPQTRRNMVLNKQPKGKENLSSEYIDYLLDKINKKGLHSLSAKEKQDLDKASKNIQ